MTSKSYPKYCHKQSLLLKPGPGPWTWTLDPDLGPGPWTLDVDPDPGPGPWTLKNLDSEKSKP